MFSDSIVSYNLKSEANELITGKRCGSELRFCLFIL